jgi:hypothetical protein
MSKWYGNLNNRLAEGYQSKPIEIGDDITMYLWSDRHCYYVVDVISDKCIKVRPWYVSADHEKAGGMGHQDWLYFKTRDEQNEYNSKFFPEYHMNDEHVEEPEPETWVFRYGKWMREWMHTEMRHPDAYTKREREHFQKHGWFKDYSDLSGKVSFGVRDYYYDWEF